MLEDALGDGEMLAAVPDAFQAWVRELHAIHNQVELDFWIHLAEGPLNVRQIRRFSRILLIIIWHLESALGDSVDVHALKFYFNASSASIRLCPWLSCLLAWTPCRPCSDKGKELHPPSNVMLKFRYPDQLSNLYKTIIHIIRHGWGVCI